MDLALAAFRRTVQRMNVHDPEDWYLVYRAGALGWLDSYCAFLQSAIEAMERDAFTTSVARAAREGLGRFLARHRLSHADNN